MLCPKCSTLPFFTDIPFLPSRPTYSQWQQTIQHHNSFISLRESAKTCPLCAVFKKSVLETYADAYSLSLEDAEDNQLLLDTTPKEWEEGEPDLEIWSHVVPAVEEPSGFFVRFEVTEVGVAGVGKGFKFEKGVRGVGYRRGYMLCESDEGDEGDERDGKGERGLFETFDHVNPFIVLSCPQGDNTVQGWIITGKERSVPIDLALAKSWIDDCTANHPACPRTTETTLPVRILDLGTPHDVDLRLAVNISTPSSYAALSHVWGGSQPLKLTESTLHPFQELIPYGSLPRTFQDAVTATRALGLCYLWIDSLCILQDSQADWQEQCARMRNIYKYAHVTLAATAARDSHTGFLSVRPASCKTTLPLPGNCREINLLQCPGTDNGRWDFKSFPDLNSRYAFRAWCLQERLLSARVLYFGRHAVSFECGTAACVETVRYPVNWRQLRSGTLPKAAFTSLLLDGNANKEGGCFHYWYRVVSTYSAMQLTVETDRLPALSGLAAAVHESTGDAYLAGIWRRDIPRALAWYTYTEEWPPTRQPPGSYLGPSWSWVATGCEVTLGNNFSGDLLLWDELRFCGRGFEVLDAKAVPEGRDPFGAVKEGAYLDVSGRFLDKSGLLLKEPYLLYQSTVGDSGEPLAAFHPDITCPEAGPDIEFMPSLLYLGEWEADDVAVAMAVELVEDNMYKRVGLVRSERRNGRREIFSRLLADAPKRQICLV